MINNGDHATPESRATNAIAEKTQHDQFSRMTDLCEIELFPIQTE